MKRFLGLLLLLLPATCSAVDNYAYAHYQRSTIMGNTDPASALGFVIDSTMTFGTSGESFGVGFVSLKAQTSGDFTCYFYCTAATGTPNEALAYIYASATGANDVDRPNSGSSPLFTSANIDFSGCATAGWNTAAFTGVTISSATTYWIVLANTEAAPLTDNFGVLTRGAVDYPIAGFTTSGSSQSDFVARENADGWTTDGTTRSQAPIVVKYNDGTIAGNPYVVVATHASNTNYRGGRFTPTENLTVIGAGFTQMDTNFSKVVLAQGSTVISETNLDVTQSARSGIVYFSSPVTLIGGTAYDILAKAGANDTFPGEITMGNSPPADVQAATSPFTYVDGATLGSLTPTATSSHMVYWIIGDNPLSKTTLIDTACIDCVVY